MAVKDKMNKDENQSLVNNEEEQLPGMKIPLQVRNQTIDLEELKLEKLKYPNIEATYLLKTDNGYELHTDNPEKLSRIITANKFEHDVKELLLDENELKTKIIRNKSDIIALKVAEKRKLEDLINNASKRQKTNEESKMNRKTRGYQVESTIKTRSKVNTRAARYKDDQHKEYKLKDDLEDGEQNLFGKYDDKEKEEEEEKDSDKGTITSSMKDEEEEEEYNSNDEDNKIVERNRKMIVIDPAVNDVMKLFELNMEDENSALKEFNDTFNAIKHSGLNLDKVRANLYLNVRTHYNLKDIPNIIMKMIGAYVNVGSNIGRLQKNVSDSITASKLSAIMRKCRITSESNNLLTLPKIALAFMPIVLRIRNVKRNDLQSQSDLIHVVYQDLSFAGCPIADKSGFRGYYEDMGLKLNAKRPKEKAVLSLCKKMRVDGKGEEEIKDACFAMLLAKKEKELEKRKSSKKKKDYEEDDEIEIEAFKTPYEWIEISKRGYEDDDFIHEFMKLAMLNVTSGRDTSIHTCLNEVKRIIVKCIITYLKDKSDPLSDLKDQYKI
jgi:hypothetical protein